VSDVVIIVLPDGQRYAVTDAATARRIYPQATIVGYEDGRPYGDAKPEGDAAPKPKAEPKPETKADE